MEVVKEVFYYLKNYQGTLTPFSLAHTAHKQVTAINQINRLVEEGVISESEVDYNKVNSIIEVLFAMNQVKQNRADVVDVLFYPADVTGEDYNFTLVLGK